MAELDKSQVIVVSLHLKPMTAIPKPIAGAPPQTTEDFEAAHGADPNDIAAIRTYAVEKGLTVVDEQPGQRIVNISGTISQIEDAFGAEMEQRPTDQGEHRFAVRAAPPIPHLGIQAILGLESAPFAKPHNRKRTGQNPHAGGARPLGPVETARRYGVVQRTATAGKTCQGGILCLGGGYTASDIAAGCQLNGIPVPTIVDHSVQGAVNSPGSDADVELYLDIIEMAGTYFARTGKPLTVHVFFCPNTDSGFVGGCLAATHSGLVCVLSISWGSAESGWGQAIGPMDQMAKGAGALGVTITAATGDNGANDGTQFPVTDYPSASPYIVAMGGTQLTDTEVVWSDPGGGATGGGISGIEAAQPWQADYGQLAGRGIPDLAANSAPATCGSLVAQGQQMDIGGTSAAAPFMAGTIAWMCEELPQNIGYLNPLLAKMPAECFRDITQGNNNGYSAKVGPDLCTGRGSPRPLAMLAALQGGTVVTPPPGNGNPPPPVTTVPTQAQVQALGDAYTDALAQALGKKHFWFGQQAAQVAEGGKPAWDAAVKHLYGG